MTQEEILEFNKRCAEFLEWKTAYEDGEEPLMYVIPKNFAWSKFYNISDEYEALTIEDLQFHESWDWIMAVIEKIKEVNDDQESFLREIFQIRFEIDLFHGVTFAVDKKPLFRQTAFGHDQLKDAVVRGISEFFRWFDIVSI